MRTLFKAVLILLFVGSSLAAIGIYVTFYRAMPIYEGSVEVPGIQSEVTIRWDDFQVPHLFADTDEDLYFAVGYIHAQERLWQMTLTQLWTEGRYAEFFGQQWVKHDRHIRTIGIPEIAERIVSRLPMGERNRLEAYARGVNAWVDANREKLPMEFVLLNMDPIAWEPKHSVGAWRKLGWEMNVSWWAEVSYSHLKARVGDPLWRELLPDYRGSYNDDLPSPVDSLPPDSLPDVGIEAMMSALGQGAPRSHPPMEGLMRFWASDRELRRLTSSPATQAGSNAWAISARKSASGFPMLAGDPHQGLYLPSTWYEAHLNRNGQNVSGITLPGIPYIVMGQNDGMAWSFTNMMADQTDFYEERLLPGTPGLYQSNSEGSIGYKPLRIRREIIRVKDGPDQVITVRSTDHGPLVSEVHDDETLASGAPLSMRWVGFEASNELTALYRLNWIDRFEPLASVVQDFRVPGMNMIYADVSGNIARYMLAQLPVRNHENLGIARGWEASHRWSGFVPFAQFPHVVNPESGYVVDANQKVEAPFHIGNFHEPDSRFRVIDRRLAGADKFTAEQMRALQLETFSMHAQEVIEELLPVLQRNRNTPEMSGTLNYLQNWDYRYERSATAASIMEVFFKQLAEISLRDDFGDAGWAAFVQHDQLPLRVMHSMLVNGSRFFDDRTTPQVETRDDMILRAIDGTVAFLTESLGSEQINWRWENLHQVKFETAFFRSGEDYGSDGSMSLIILYMLNRGPFGSQGHTTSPVSGQYAWDDGFRQVAGATWRRVIDLENPTQSWSVIPGGQSGNPLSEAYDDQLDLWLDGKYRTFQHNSELRFRDDLPALKLTKRE